MKTSVLTFAALVLISAAAFGQSKEVYDDIYFKPGDVVKQTERPLVKKPVYKNGAKEIVFIERGQNVEIVSPDTTILLGEANDSTEQNREEGYYLNGFNGTESDLEYADRIRKFHNPKYRVFIGDPAYNDIYYLNNIDWNVYVDGNSAYVTPTWTNPYWYDYTFNSNSYMGWNSWNYGYPSYGHHYGWGNYPWAMNNYWGFGGYNSGYYGNYYGNYYGGYYGSYYGGCYGYGMGYPYYGYGGNGYYGGYYGGGYGGGNTAAISSRGSGSRQLTNLRTTTIGGSSAYRSPSVRSNYTTIGENNRSVVNNNGMRSIRSASDYAGRNTAIQNNSRTSTNRNTAGESNYRPSTYRSSTITTNRAAGSTTDAVNRSTYTSGSRETSTRSGYNQGVSTSPRTSYSTQQNHSARSGSVNSDNTSTRSSYSTGTPTVTRQSGSTYSNGSTSTRSSSSGSSSYRSSTPSSSYSTPSSSYSSGSSSYSGGSSSGSSSSSSSSSSNSGGGGGGGRR